MSTAPPLALVTAGGRRVGAAICAALARAGWRLAIHGRTDATPEPALAAVLAETGATWAGFTADLCDPAAVDSLWRDVCAWGGVPSLLVNNAALFTNDTPATATAESIRRHQAINCEAPVRLTQLLWQHTPDAARACSICLLDQRIAQPNADQFSYTLSKLALAGAVRVLARSLAPRLRVNAVAPGLTLPTDDYTADQMRRLRADMPLETLPDPAAIASAVLWLASADQVTNQTLYVDAGAHMQYYARDFMFMETDGPTPA